MTEKNKQQKINILSWVVIGIATLVAFFITYYFNLSGAIKAVVWLIWFVLSLGLGSLTTKGKQSLVFIKESRIELLKVVWPTRQETIQTTTIVMIMVAVTGFVLWGVDSGMMWIIGKITHLG